jgi:[ribosomal protein S5]-alanine N-acetyltransferase
MLSNIGTETILTERTILRKFDYSDNSDMRKYWVGDSKIQSMYSEPVYTTESEVKELLSKIIESYENDHYYRWAIILKETNECIGQFAFFLVDQKNHFGEIEYCIGSKFQQKGLATEVTKAIMHFGFKRINLHKIQVCHKSNNEPSKNLIIKCGFKYEGTLRDFFHMDGTYVDRLYYSMLDNEYK